MQPIKALVLTSSFPLSQNSISGIFVKHLVDNLAQQIEMIVLTPCDRSNVVCQENYDYDVICFKYAPKIFQVLAHGPGGIPAILKSNKLYLLLVPGFLVSMFVKCLVYVEKVDLIHANWSICGIVGGIVGSLFSKPVITTLRGEDVNKAENNLILRLLIKATVKYSSTIICVSESMMHKIHKIANCEKTKIKFISNGIDKKLTEKYKKKNNSIKKDIILTTAGSLTENKNTVSVLKAVNNLTKRGFKVTLNIIGDGPCKQSIQNMIIKFNLQDNVIIHGALCQEDVFRIVGKSNIFILASYREGRPNVVLEAMAMGALVIASKIEGVMELIEDQYTGLLFDPNDFNTLEECIKKVINSNELLNQLPENALNYIRDRNLYWNETAEKYMDVYNSSLCS